MHIQQATYKTHFFQARYRPAKRYRISHNIMIINDLICPSNPVAMYA